MDWRTKTGAERNKKNRAMDLNAIISCLYVSETKWTKTNEISRMILILVVQTRQSVQKLFKYLVSYFRFTG